MVIIVSPFDKPAAVGFSTHTSLKHRTTRSSLGRKSRTTRHSCGLFQDKI